MVPFSALLQAHLTTRGWSQSEFARQVKMTPASISSIMSGKRKPWFERAEAWADALTLQGRQREDFLDAMAIAASPSRVSTIIARIERAKRSP